MKIEYTHRFISECPINCDLITYELVITSDERIMVEHIKTRCAMHRKALHEDIAEDLGSSFPGDQELTAVHGGVKIKTKVKNRG